MNLLTPLSRRHQTCTFGACPWRSSGGWRQYKRRHAAVSSNQQPVGLGGPTGC